MPLDIYTMASSRLFRRILALWVWLSLLSTASAQNVAPTNASSTATKPPQFQLQTTQTMSQSTYKMYPLTADAGLSGTAQQLNVRYYVSKFILSKILTLS